VNMKRRVFLKGALASGTVALALGAGIVTPRAVLAAWPKSAFEAKSVADALGALYGSGDAAASGDIEIKAPDIAENGAVVPVSVTAKMSGVESISIFAEGNNSPLTSNWKLGPDAEPYVSTRIKMAKTSNVIAVVQANGKTFQAAKEVKVTIGGCGG